MDKIKEALPYEHCRTCSDCVLNVKEQGTFIDGISYNMTVVRCKNEQKCKKEMERNGR